MELALTCSVYYIHILLVGETDFRFPILRDVTLAPQSAPILILQELNNRYVVVKKCLSWRDFDFNEFYYYYNYYFRSFQPQVEETMMLKRKNKYENKDKREKQLKRSQNQIDVNNTSNVVQFIETTNNLSITKYNPDVQNFCVVDENNNMYYVSENKYTFLWNELPTPIFFLLLEEKKKMSV
jgi:hypothetical protein